MNAGKPPRNTWPREHTEMLESLVARGGYTVSGLAKALGRSVTSVQWQLSYLKLHSAEDGRGAEFLNRNEPPIIRAIHIMQSRGVYRYDENEGHMIRGKYGYRAITVQQLCDTAGVERPQS